MELIFIEFIVGFSALFLGLRYWLRPLGVRDGSLLSAIMWLVLIFVYKSIIPRASVILYGHGFALPLVTTWIVHPHSIWIVLPIFALLMVGCIAKDFYPRWRRWGIAFDVLWVCTVALLYYALHAPNVHVVAVFPSAQNYFGSP